MRRLIAAAALAAVLAGCGSSKPHSNLTVRVDQSPFRLTIMRSGRLVVAENATARLRYQLTDGDQHSLTKVTSSHGDTYEVATDEPGRTATVTVDSTADGFDIGVQLEPATNVQDVFDAFTATPDEHFLGGGERASTVDLRGQIVPIEVGCSYAPIPFFASSAGWGLRIASENVSALAFPGSTGGTGGCQIGSEPACSFEPLTDLTEVCEVGARLDEDIYVGSLQQTLADYEADTGRPKVPPPSELALIKWRDQVTGPGQILDDIERFQGAKIPIGWVILDNRWEVCNGFLTFDTGLIPDPAELIKEVHAAGVEFMLWISPRAVCPDGYPAKGLLGTPGNDQILDLRKHAVVAEFRARLRKLFALGVDGVKGDRGDENDLQPVSPSLTNEYPLLFARAAIGAMPKGDAAIFRAATVGSQAVLPGIWAGDQEGIWTGLQQAVTAAQTAAMSGFPTWGSDIGGYSSEGLTPDVFERWAQLGAISPVMEVGGKGPNAVPWTLGTQAMDVLRDAATLHYELFPYLDGLLQRHQPVLRPLAYGFPGDQQAWGASTELLVGPDLLAEPVNGPGTTPSVYLPAGSWIDLFTAAPAQGGGASFTRPTPMNQFPLYVKQGSVIPFNLRTATGSWWGIDELSHPGRAGYLATNGAVLALTRQPHDVQVFVPAPAKPEHVTIGGRAVAWSWTAGPLPGVVIRVHGPHVRGRVVLA